MRRGARTTLDELIRLNPDFRSPAGHLLYARALEGEGNFAKALEEYACGGRVIPRCRGRGALRAAAARRRVVIEEAQKVARELLQQARIAPGHYRRAQREWLEAAERLV